ncbi:MAG: Arm DNA-binding domain-containing protein, partial [Bacteroidota bacterium]
MATTSVKLYQKASKRRKDGTAPIYVRIIVDRKSSLVSTGISVEPKFWNADKGRVRASHDI